MRIGIVQMNCAAGEIQRNLEKMQAFLSRASAARCDTIVFPEMSDTGYSMPIILKTASRWDGKPLSTLRKAAQQHALNIVVGLSEKTDTGVFNTIAAIDRVGEVVAKYRKTHLITAEPVREQEFLLYGDEAVVGSLDGMKVGFLTCYDIRFSEMSRLLSNAGAQFIFTPAAFPKARIAHWRVLVEARAIENQVFVLAANRVGNDGPGLTFGGNSRVVDPSGVVLVSASDDEETMLVADLDTARISATRSELQVQRDRRPELYAKQVKVY